MGHILYATAVEPADQVLVVCRLCGAYTETRLEGLGRQCRGKALVPNTSSGHAAINSVWVKGQHPGKKHIKVGPPWPLGNLTGEEARLFKIGMGEQKKS